MVISDRQWDRPLLSPVPVWIKDIGEPVMDLCGKWMWIRNPEEGFERDYEQRFDWQEIDIPCEIGKSQAKGSRYVLRKLVRTPSVPKGYRFVLRFQAVNHRARLWIDGEKVMEHAGSYVPWECEITSHIVPNSYFLLIVEIDGEPELSPYNTGGILRPVLLVIRPPVFFARFHVDAQPNEDLKHAAVRINLGINRPADARVRILLFDPSDRPVLLEREEWPVPEGVKEWEISAGIQKPELWDCEHPRLYTIIAVLIVDRNEIERVERKIGIRSIKTEGCRMYINNQPVKLRGICRQDTPPQQGRSVRPELLEREIRLYKQANINYIHTMYYPPSETFIDLCDRYGLYVQEDMALTHIDRLLPATQNDPALEKDYVMAAAELLERDRSHASVIMWSLGSECSWGANFRKAFRYIKEEKTNRPVLFHQPMTVYADRELQEIWPVHHCAWDLDFGKHYDHMLMTMTFGSREAPGYLNGCADGLNLPVLHDQAVKVPCDDRETLRCDPGIHSFWGESILRVWEKIRATEGALGCAVASGIDDVFLPEERFCECGILDASLRKKPEYELLRKVYTPVRMHLEGIGTPGRYELTITTENRFIHSNLSEVTLHWACGKDSGVIAGPNCEPSQTGCFVLPERLWRENEELLLRIEHNGTVIEEDKIRFIGSIPDCGSAVKEALPLEVTEHADHWVIKNNWLEYIWDKSTGQLRSAAAGNEKLLCAGPSLHITGFPLEPFILREFRITPHQGCVSVNVSGSYGKQIDISFLVEMDEFGSLTTSYRLEKVNVPMPGRVKMKAGLSCGGLNEVGICYTLSEGTDRMRFKCRDPWFGLPDDHIARSEGLCFYDTGGEPGESWAMEKRNEGLNTAFDPGLNGSNDFRAMRCNLYSAGVGKSVSPFEFCLVSDGSGAIRLEPDWSAFILDDRDPSVGYVGEWYAVEDSRCWNHTEMYSNRKGSYAEVCFTGTGIVWTGSRDMIGGYANIYVDGQYQECVGQYSQEADFPGMSRGYEKRYGNILYSIKNLRFEKHTLRIEVTGEMERDSQDAYVMIDRFMILKPDQRPAVKMLALSDFNYPRIAGGNYTKPPVHVFDGYERTLRLFLQKRREGEKK